MANVSTLSSAIIANADWLADAQNQDTLKHFLRASQRGWQDAFEHRDEAAEIFLKHASVFNKEIALLEINGTMTLVHTDKTKDKPIGWSAEDDWRDTQDLLSKYANLTAQSNLGIYFTNEYLSAPPYLPKK
jgi:NitT/TauT family transport system substrate-binding protein